MATPLKKGKPPWLYRQKEEDLKNPNYRRAHRYYVHLYQAWPDWADQEKIEALYRECWRRRKAGENVHVDHIVPVVHPHVSGLHCPDNLQIITEFENLTKSNRVWPDMWGEQKVMEFPIPAPFQLRLI